MVTVKSSSSWTVASLVGFVCVRMDFTETVFKESCEVSDVQTEFFLKKRGRAGFIVR